MAGDLSAITAHRLWHPPLLQDCCTGRTAGRLWSLEAKHLLCEGFQRWSTLGACRATKRRQR